MANQFYPLNFYLTRPDARASLKDLQDRLDRGAAVNPDISSKIVTDHVFKRLLGLGWSREMPIGTAIVSQEMQGVLAWSQWVINGRRIVSVTETLVHAFEHSKCGDLRIADVLIQESGSLYLHFEGKMHDPIELGDGATIEGAYVISAPQQALRVVLCARMGHGKPALNQWRERYDLRIPANLFDLSADEAIDLALAEDLTDIQAVREKVSAQPAFNSVAAVDALMQRMQEGHAAYKKTLHLVLNALAYLKHYNEDSRSDWPAAAPERLVKQVQNGTPKEVARAQSKLWALGFIPVTYLGDEFAQTLERNSPHGSVRAHWRMGHWRSQPYGPQSSLRKIIWIRPTRIGLKDD